MPEESTLPTSHTLVSTVPVRIALISTV
jgi:hypothetical protein